MRVLFGLVWLLALLPLTARAESVCRCPALSLDERIEDAVTIFVGRPLVTAPVPAGGSPFHSEATIEDPHGAPPNNWVTLFQVETLWKGEARRTLRVRHEPGDCAVTFKQDVPAIVFAQADDFGVLWTRLCSGDVLQGEAGYEDMKQTLTSRLKFD